MPPRSEDLFLQDILEACHAIQMETGGLSLETFSQVRVVRSAALHELTVIGEAASKLSPELRARHPEVAWTDIIGFRHVIVHGYFGLNWQRVWTTIVRDVPQLEVQVRAIIATEFPDTRSG